MIQRGEHCASRSKRARRSGSVASTSGRTLMRDGAIQLGVAGAIDFTHATCTHRRFDPVGAGAFTSPIRGVPCVLGNAPRSVPVPAFREIDRHLGHSPRVTRPLAAVLHRRHTLHARMPAAHVAHGRAPRQRVDRRAAYRSSFMKLRRRRVALASVCRPSSRDAARPGLSSTRD